MIFVFWDVPEHEATCYHDAPVGTVIRASRWWDARCLFVKLSGDLPKYWEHWEPDELESDPASYDYEIEWRGHAAQSMHNLNAFYRKSGAKKWHPLT